MLHPAAQHDIDSAPERHLQPCSIVFMTALFRLHRPCLRPDLAAKPHGALRHYAQKRYGMGSYCTRLLLSCCTSKPGNLPAAKMLEAELWHASFQKIMQRQSTRQLCMNQHQQVPHLQALQSCICTCGQILFHKAVHATLTFAGLMCMLKPCDYMFSGPTHTQKLTA